MVEEDPTHETAGVAAEAIRGHPAAIAWRRLSPRGIEHIVLLKKKQRGAVYALEGAGPTGERVIAKRCQGFKGVVERALYEEVLPRLTNPLPACYGAMTDGDSTWLFLEDVGGLPYSPDLAGHREAAARRIAELHTAVRREDVRTVLPDRGPEHYKSYLQKIVDELPRFRDQGPDVLDPIVSQCESIGSRWQTIEDLCRRAPEALIHGDCLSKNVHIREGRAAIFDWGGAGWGPAATDLGLLALPHRGPPVDEPDCDSYWDVARRRWPQLDQDMVRRLAMLGQLFWALKVIARGMDEFEHAWREPRYVVADFVIYARALARST